MATWQGHTHSVNALALSPDGRWALSGSWDKTIKRWEIVDRQVIWQPGRGILCV